MLYRIIRAILIPLLYLFYRPRIHGRENIPIQGKAIVYSNHTSLLDPVVLGCILPRPIHFMAKQELFKYRILAALMKRIGAFPVKRGTADISAVKTSLRILQEDRIFGIFPEGTRSKSGTVERFSHGIASIAIKSQAPVIPVVIANGYRLFRQVTISIGNPIDLSRYYGKRTSTDILLSVSDEMADALKTILKNQV